MSANPIHVNFLQRGQDKKICSHRPYGVAESKKLKSDSGAGFRAGIVTPLVAVCFRRPFWFSSFLCWWIQWGMFKIKRKSFPILYSLYIRPLAVLPFRLTKIYSFFSIDVSAPLGSNKRATAACCEQGALGWVVAPLHRNPSDKLWVVHKFANMWWQQAYFPQQLSFAQNSSWGEQAVQHPTQHNNF